VWRFTVSAGGGRGGVVLEHGAQDDGGLLLVVHQVADEGHYVVRRDVAAVDGEQARVRVGRDLQRSVAGRLRAVTGGERNRRAPNRPCP